MSKEPTSEVLLMHKISFTGNVIPHSWYQKLKFPSGLVNLPAIIILSEICYWYRPTEIRDEEVPESLKLQKKFSADKLQRSYDSFKSLGLSRKQAFDACHYLQDLDLITLETRTITTKSGIRIPNVLFIGINPREVSKLNQPIPSETALPSSNDPLPSSNDPLPSSNTCTESTGTENSTDTLIADKPQALEKVPQIPIVKLDTLNSKQDVLYALLNLGKNSLDAQNLAKTVTVEEIKAVQDQCTKKHKLCTCPTQKEKPLLKVLNEGINILSSGAVNWSREGANANSLACILRTSKYTLEDVIYCMAWGYQTGQFDFYAYSLLSIPKIMPKYLDLNRTGKLKESLMGTLKESATQRNDRRFEVLQNNEEEFITNATRHNESFREQHGITKQPII